MECTLSVTHHLAVPSLPELSAGDTEVNFISAPSWKLDSIMRDDGIISVRSGDVSTVRHNSLFTESKKRDNSLIFFVCVRRQSRGGGGGGDAVSHSCF